MPAYSDHDWLCDFDKLQDDFNNTNYAYSYAYTIGRFMLDNYSQEQLLEYVKYPEKLKEERYNKFRKMGKFIES